MKPTRSLFAFLALAIAPALFTGCVSFQNPIAQYYSDRIGASITNLPPYSGTTAIYGMSNPDEDVKTFARKGYAMIGVSGCRGAGAVSEQMLRSQASKVGADIVLYCSKYLGSRQSAIPYFNYVPGETYTTTTSGTVNANAYGSGGYAYGTGYYNGTSTTTSPGTFSTQWVPVTLQDYGHEALFFRKTLPSIFGVWPATELKEEVRQKIQRNGGVMAWVVIDDSPAFRANILEGDVILKIGGEDASSPMVSDQILKRLAGQKVDVEIWRNGETKVISLQLNVRVMLPPPKK